MSAIAELIDAERLPAGYRDIVERQWRPLADRIAAATPLPRVIGINGAQGSGKTTLCRFLRPLLADRGIRAVTLSLDDFYLPRADRLAIAREYHPLFATRGVPGTHDPELLGRVLDRLADGYPALAPSFDKAEDDRAAECVAIEPPADVILLEGWCVGAAPQPAVDLRQPVNRLEADEDTDGTWRREVNRRLATDYAALFARLDWLIMLAVESFDAVRANRLVQERKLAARRPMGAALMDEIALERFLMHYERLTRWMLREMPARADIVLRIGRDQRPC